MAEATSEPKPKRRWYQFHLWHLFVLTPQGQAALVLALFIPHALRNVSIQSRSVSIVSHSS